MFRPLLPFRHRAKGHQLPSHIPDFSVPRKLVAVRTPEWLNGFWDAWLVIDRGDKRTFGPFRCGVVAADTLQVRTTSDGDNRDHSLSAFRAARYLIHEILPIFSNFSPTTRHWSFCSVRAFRRGHVLATSAGGEHSGQRGLARTRRFVQAHAVAPETLSTRPSAPQPSRKPRLMRKSSRGPGGPGTTEQSLAFGAGGRALISASAQTRVPADLVGLRFISKRLRSCAPSGRSHDRGGADSVTFR